MKLSISRALQSEHVRWFCVLAYLLAISVPWAGLPKDLFWVDQLKLEGLNMTALTDMGCDGIPMYEFRETQIANKSSCYSNCLSSNYTCNYLQIVNASCLVYFNCRHIHLADSLLHEPYYRKHSFFCDYGLEILTTIVIVAWTSTCISSVCCCCFLHIIVWNVDGESQGAGLCKILYNKCPLMYIALLTLVVQVPIFATTESLITIGGYASYECQQYHDPHSTSGDNEYSYVTTCALIVIAFVQVFVLLSNIGQAMNAYLFEKFSNIYEVRFSKKIARTQSQFIEFSTEFREHRHYLLQKKFPPLVVELILEFVEELSTFTPEGDDVTVCRHYKVRYEYLYQQLEYHPITYAELELKERNAGTPQSGTRILEPTFIDREEDWVEIVITPRVRTWNPD